jgi:RND family efflux transporter MFP subunit
MQSKLLSTELCRPAMPRTLILTLRSRIPVISAGVVLLGLAGLAVSQEEEGSAPAATTESQQAVIERLPLVLRDPVTYQTLLHLEPAVSIEVVAPIDGVVGSIPVEVGEKYAKQTEAARLESTERQLELDRAKAAFQAAQLESEAADAAMQPVAAARLDVAKAELRLAEYHLEQAVLRIPFDGTVTAVHVVPGQFVRAGQPVLTVADLTKLAVDVPVDRNQVQAGAPLELKIEATTAQGTVESIEPLHERFNPLRALFVSVATARVVIDNPGDKFSNGQTVHSDLIPKHPVTEIPTLALGNTPEGERRVQVIREGFVRDVGVVLLGQEGDEYVYVSGRFGPTDELVVKSSQELLDGMRVVPSAAAGTNQNTGNNTNRPPARTQTDF